MQKEQKLMRSQFARNQFNISQIPQSTGMTSSQLPDSSQLVLSRRPMAALTNNVPIRNIPDGITFEEVLALRDQAKSVPAKPVSNKNQPNPSGETNSANKQTDHVNKEKKSRGNKKGSTRKPYNTKKRQAAAAAAANNKNESDSSDD